MYKQLILAINPGSTSTKIAVFDGEEKLFDKNIKHQSEDLKKFEHIADQYAFRKELVLNEVEQAGFNIKEFKIVIG
ncbi:MAG: butyrate kinase, partial [Bacteroidales bacterium]|nr:butyrate kinase [Bacteroidales bacterium]